MKKECKLLALVLITSVIIVLSVNITSAYWTCSGTSGYQTVSNAQCDPSVGYTAWDWKNFKYYTDNAHCYFTSDASDQTFVYPYSTTWWSYGYLGSKKCISGISLEIWNYKDYNYVDVYLSDDGVNWGSPVATNLYNSGDTHYTFSETQATYVKVVIHGCVSNDIGCEIAEYQPLTRPYVCIPDTCVSLGKQCGSWPDSCGGTLNCGVCTGGCSQCNANGQCVAKTAGILCRASIGVCDITEYCDGSSVWCPPDSFNPPTTKCRDATGLCDLAAYCSGSSAPCPANPFKPSTTICRASSGVCDKIEYCSGTSSNCPGDLFSSSTTVCRASIGQCDNQENCTGSSVSCPSDSKKSDGTECDTSLPTLSPFLLFLRFFGIDLIAQGQGFCSGGNCVDSCIPNCEGKDCGGNGCWGYCGSLNGNCPGGQNCNATGQCVNTCVSQCTSAGEKRCNVQYSQTCSDYNSDGCLEWGGDIDCNYGCNSLTGNCNPCVANCIEKQCGNNGCGGYCPPGCSGSTPTCNSTGQCVSGSDIYAPRISFVEWSVTTTTATINWSTSEDANSSVIYGINILNLNNHQENSSLVLNHSLILNGLSSSTIYYFNLTSCDNASNCAKNGTYNFTTNAENTPPPNPPGPGPGSGPSSPPNTCTENWSCGSWGICQNRAVKRICIDANGCGTDLHKPITSLSCIISQENLTENPKAIRSDGSMDFIKNNGLIPLIILILLIIILILVIIRFILKNYKKKEKPSSKVKIIFSDKDKKPPIFIRQPRENFEKKLLMIKAINLAKEARKRGISESQIEKMFRDKNWYYKDIIEIIQKSR